MDNYAFIQTVRDFFMQLVRDELEYYANNPSAWMHYDDCVSEKIKKVCDAARDIQSLSAKIQKV